MKSLLNRLHQALARWRWAVLVALKVRNQCDAVIAYHLAPSPDPAVNGEWWLIHRFGSGIRTFIDVGARHGHWTNLVMHHAAPVRGLLFEPDDGCLPGLRAELGQHAHLEICAVALGAEPGELAFRVDGERSRLVVPGESTMGARMVTVSTLDRELAARGLATIDLVKVDAEGHDFQVIRGSAEALAAQRIGILQFEYGDRWPHAGATLAGAIGFLTARGYETYLLRPDGLAPAHHEVWGEHFSYSNYVAFAPAWRARIAPWIRH